MSLVFEVLHNGDERSSEVVPSAEPAGALTLDPMAPMALLGSWWTETEVVLPAVSLPAVGLENIEMIWRFWRLTTAPTLAYML